MKKVLYFIVLVSSAIIYSGCDDTITVQDVDNREIPDSNVSFSKDISQIFELKCVSCHGNGGLDGGVDLTTWAGVVDPRIVIPGEADTSPLVWTIEQRSGFPIMPPRDSPFLPLTSKQIQGVKTWIDEGAKNN
ncbi:MAG: hypothetical protein IH852_16240 [Bacteroidetes bacterium]|nr:hypothetical protein [Bacteroidota bacterium]